MRKPRIGIFGGTFDPIHQGHLEAARLVRRRFSLDEILFIPSFIPPHKARTDMASPSDRLNMVKLAVCLSPHFIPSAIEIEARGKSYSIRTLKKLRLLYPGAWLFFVLGVDAFLEIATWREYDRVVEQCLFIVITRPGFELNKAGDVLGGRYREVMFPVRKGDRVKESLFRTYKIFLLPITALDISSTEVRGRIRNREHIRGLVPASVEAFILAKKLYRPG
jgi:nicotinate-nucleotide adenylyltransferase